MHIKIKFKSDCSSIYGSDLCILMPRFVVYNIINTAQEQPVVEICLFTKLIC